MKKLGFLVTSVMLVLGMLVTPFAFADDVADAVAEHQKMAGSYAEKIAAQDALIAEHQQMKKDYADRFAINPKVGPPAAIEKMNTHCDLIIADAQKLKADLQEFAQWHTMRAAELQGQ